MPRIFCVDCGIPVVVDPQGRCPEGHVLTGADPDIGSLHGHPTGSVHGQGHGGEPPRIDLDDALHTDGGTPGAASGPDASDADAAVDAPVDVSVHADVGHDADDEPEPWVWEVADDEPMDPGADADAGSEPRAAQAADDVRRAVEEADDSPARHAPGPVRPGVVPSPQTTGGGDLFEELRDIEVAPDGSGGTRAVAGDTDAVPGDPDADLPADAGGTATGAGATATDAGGTATDADDLAFLFDPVPPPDGGPPATGDTGSSNEGDRPTQPIPVSSSPASPAADTARSSSDVDPTNFTARGGRVGEVPPAAGGWRARLARRRVS